MTADTGERAPGGRSGDAPPVRRDDENPVYVSSVVRRPPGSKARGRYVVTLSARPGLRSGVLPAEPGATPSGPVTDDADPLVGEPPAVEDHEVDDRPSLWSELADPDPEPEPGPEPEVDPEPEPRSESQPEPEVVPVAQPRRPKPGPPVRPASAGRPRPRPAGAPRPMPAGPGRPGPPGPGSSSRRRRWPIVVALIAFALSVGVPLLVRALVTDDAGRHRASPAPTHGPTPISEAPATTGAAAARTAVTAWTRRSLPAQAVVVTDRVTVTDLRRAGFASALPFGDSRAKSLDRVDYLIDVAGGGATDDGASKARRILLDHSLPLAIFGPARQQSSVRQVFPTGIGAARTRLKSDPALRRTGGRELLDNPALVPDARTRAALRHGRLDLRAENVLSDLATTDRVYVSNPVRDPAERRAGQPIRSLVVTTSDIRATQSVLDALGPPYRPQTIESISPRKIRIVWLPVIAAETTVGG